MSSKFLLALRAREMCVRTGIRSNWAPLGERGSGEVNVFVIERVVGQAYVLQVETPPDDEPENDEQEPVYAETNSQRSLLCCKITNALEYSVKDRTFHYFGVDPTTEYGLRFRSPDDALEFSNKIIGIKSTLLKASRKAKKREEKKRRREQFHQIEKIAEIAEEEEPMPVVANEPAMHTPVQELELLTARLSKKEEEREAVAEKDKDSLASGNGSGHSSGPTPDVDALAVRVLSRGSVIGGDGTVAEEEELEELDTSQSGYYVQFFPGDPAAQGNAVPVKKREETEPPLLPHQYETIEEDVDLDNTFCDRRPKSSHAEPTASTPTVAVRPSCASSSTVQTNDATAAPVSSALPQRGGEQAPPTHPRSPLPHKKLARQSPRNIPMSVHKSNKEQLEDHQRWIKQQEDALKFYEQKKVRKARDHEEQTIREEIMVNPDLLAKPSSRTPPENGSTPPEAGSSSRRQSRMSQIAVIMTEEQRKEKKPQKENSLDKPPVTEEPGPVRAQPLAKRRAVCKFCGAFYDVECNQVGDCEEGPSTCKTIINVISCLEIASCVTYWFASDEENEYVFPYQCSPNSEEDRVCCRRWTALCLCGICCPCMFCYYPLKVCLDIGSCLHVCGSPHEEGDDTQTQAG